MVFNRNIILKVLYTIFFIAGCNSKNEPFQTCVPNHEQNGVGILLSSTQNPVERFRLEVCYVNRNYPGTATLYGLFGENNITAINTEAQKELQNFKLVPGAIYSFRFEGDEDFFAIFLDGEDGNLVTVFEVMRGDIYN